MRQRTLRVMVGIAVASALSTSSAFAVGAACPSGGTPAPGSKVHKLKVDGICILNGVTVDEGVEILSTGHLQLQSSTVNGGIVVDTGGELDVNAIG